MSNEPDEIESALERATGVLPPSGPAAPGGYDWGVAPADSEPRDPKVIQSVETLWAKHPYIGDGNHVIHVTRLEPQKWKGDCISGLIDDHLVDQLSMMEFRERYGGGKYRLQVCGFAGGGRTGIHQFRAKGEPIIVTCPGRPNPKYFFADKEESDVSDLTQTLIEKVLTSSDVTQQKIGQAMAAARSTEQGAFDGAMRLSSERVAEVRSMHEGVIASLREDLAREKSTVSDLETKVRSLQEEVTRVTREAETRIANEDMRRVKESREIHDQVVRDLSHKHEEELRRIREDASIRAADARQRWDDQLSQLRAQFDSERSTLNGRIDQIRTESSQRLMDETRRLDEINKLRYEQSRENYESRIADLQRISSERVDSLTRSHDAELRTLTASHAAQLASARDVATIQISSNDAVTKQHITMLRQKIDEMTAELNRIRDENDSLREEKYKPAHVAVAEARALLDELSPPAPEEKPTEPKDWKQTALEMVPGVLSVVAQRLSNPPAQVVPTAAAGQAAAAQQLPTGRPPLQPANGQRRRPMRPAGYDPADYPVGVSAPPRQRPEGPLRPLDANTAVAAPPIAAPQASPVVAQPQVAPVQASSEAPVAVATEQVAVAPQEQSPDNGSIQMFATQLDSAFQRGVPPEVVAEEFIRLAGEQAAQVVQSVSPGDVVTVMKQQPGGEASPLVSFRGKKYLEAIWAAARSRLAAPSA